MKYKSFFTFLFVLLAASLVAQDILHYKFDHFRPESGLSGIYVRKIIQDPYGFIWAGTADGLNRYDGKNFMVYNKDAAPGRALTGSDIRDLLIDSATSSLWSLNSYGGIDGINYQTGKVTFRFEQNLDPVSHNILFSSIALYGDQLFLSGTNGLYSLSPTTGKMKRLSLRNPFQPGQIFPVINKLLRLGDQSLLLFCEGAGVAVFNLSTLSFTGVATETGSGTTPGVIYYDVVRYREDQVVCATSKGLLVYRLSGGKPFKESPAFLRSMPDQRHEIYSCSIDQRGHLWFSSTNYLMRLQPETGKLFQVKENESRSDPDWLGAVYAIYFDKRGDVWLGCQQGLAYSVNAPSPFFRFSASQTSPESRIHHAYYLDPQNDSILYSCAQDGLFRIQTKTGAIVTMDKGVPYYHSFLDPFGRQMVANLNGTFLLKGKSLAPAASLYPEFGRLGKIIVNSHCYFGDSLVILGTENHRGIILWNYKSHRVFNLNSETSEPRLRENIINTVYGDKATGVWLLGDQSIGLLDPVSRNIRWLNLVNERTKQAFSIFFDVCRVKKNYIVASYGAGVLVLDSNLRFQRLLTTTDGLTANSVYKVLPWLDSLLFTTSNNGLTVLDPTDSFSVAQQYFESDGLHGNGFEENSGQVFGYVLYAGGDGGVTFIDPAKLPSSFRLSRPYIDRIRVERTNGITDTANLEMLSYNLPSNTLQTTIYFSSANYTNPKRNKFMYRIKESGDGWTELGELASINLVGLAPGSYTLEVKATGGDHRMDSPVTKFVLHMLPKWYQTYFFRISVLLLALVLGYLFFRNRVRQLRREEQIRKEIAGDLHDDIGSTLNAVKVYTHLLQTEPEKKEYLQNIDESLTNVSAGLRDIIWVLDNSDDTLQQLFERIKKAIAPLLMARQVTLQTSLAPELALQKISKKEKRNLLLVTKEAVNNCIKHAACRRVGVSILDQSGKITLRVEDDGKGFDTGEPMEGHGLKSIRHRAAQIHYTVTVVSAIGQGTTIELQRK